MSKLDFGAMSQQALQAYILAHRDDQEAFYAFVDKLHAEATWVDMPPLQSLEDLEQHPEFVEHIRNRSDSYDQA